VHTTVSRYHGMIVLEVRTVSEAVEAIQLLGDTAGDVKIVVTHDASPSARARAWQDGSVACQGQEKEEEKTSRSHGWAWRQCDLRARDPALAWESGDSGPRCQSGAASDEQRWLPRPCHGSRGPWAGSHPSCLADRSAGASVRCGGASGARPSAHVRRDDVLPAQSQRQSLAAELQSAAVTDGCDHLVTLPEPVAAGRPCDGGSDSSRAHWSTGRCSPADVRRESSGESGTATRGQGHGRRGRRRRRPPPAERWRAQWSCGSIRTGSSGCDGANVDTSAGASSVFSDGSAEQVPAGQASEASAVQSETIALDADAAGSARIVIRGTFLELRQEGAGTCERRAQSEPPARQSHDAEAAVVEPAWRGSSVMLPAERQATEYFLLTPRALRSDVSEVGGSCDPAPVQEASCDGLPAVSCITSGACGWPSLSHTGHPRASDHGNGLPAVDRSGCVEHASLRSGISAHGDGPPAVCRSGEVAVARHEQFRDAGDESSAAFAGNVSAAEEATDTGDAVHLSLQDQVLGHDTLACAVALLVGRHACTALAATARGLSGLSCFHDPRPDPGPAGVDVVHSDADVEVVDDRAAGVQDPGGAGGAPQHVLAPHAGGSELPCEDLLGFLRDELRVDGLLDICLDHTADGYELILCVRRRPAWWSRSRVEHIVEAIRDRFMLPLTVPLDVFATMGRLA